MSEQKVKKYRVGIIGAGLMGTPHARAYNENPMTQVVAVADIDPENLGMFCSRFGVPGYSTYDEMFEKEQIDIAGPVLPVSANPDAVVAAAKAGAKAVFAEKPIAASLEDADRMVEACLSRSVAFACGDAFRNLPQYWQAKEMIDAGEIGEVQSINLYQSTTEISGGGCQGLSLMRLYAGDAEVDWVVGRVSCDPWSDEDQAMGGYIQFANDVEGYLQHKPAAKKGIEVIGSQGVFFSDYGSFHLWKLKAGADPNNARWSELQAVPGLFEDTDTFERSYHADGWRMTGQRTAASIQSIVDALEKGIEPRCTGDNMRKVLEIAIALRESHRRDHARVDMPLEDRSLKLYPRKSRWLNKKEVYGEERYSDIFEVIKKTR